LLHSSLEDDRRLYEIVAKLKSRLSMQLSSSGHATAAGRVLSYLSQLNAFQDAISGIGFYQLIEDLEANFEEKKQRMKDKLRLLVQELFHREGLFVSITSDEEGLALLRKPFTAFVERLPHAEYEKKREKLLDDLKALEQEWGKIVQLEEAGKEVPEEIQRKIYAAIEVQGLKLA